VPEVVIEGISDPLTMHPASFLVTSGVAPNGPAGWYAKVQPILVTVQPVALDGQPTPNFRGTVSLSGNGLSFSTASRAWTGAEPAGAFTFTDVVGKVAGLYQVTATAGPASGESAPIPVSEAMVVVNPLFTSSKEAYGGASIVVTRWPMGASGGVNTADSTTVFQVAVSEAAADGSVKLAGQAAIRAVNGSFPIVLSNASVDEMVTVGGVAIPGLPVQSAIWQWTASANPAMTLMVLQFEQAPNTSAYTDPVAPSLSGISPVIVPQAGFSGAGGGVFRTAGGAALKVAMDGTRYDAAVAMGHRLVAPSEYGEFFSRGWGGFDPAWLLYSGWRPGEFSAWDELKKRYGRLKGRTQALGGPVGDEGDLLIPDDLRVAEEGAEDFLVFFPGSGWGWDDGGLTEGKGAEAKEGEGEPLQEERVLEEGPP